MTFVNEKKIPDEYLDIYNLRSFVDQLSIHNGWTIDYERTIFLNFNSRGIEEYSNYCYWLFFWKNNLLNITTVQEYLGDCHRKYNRLIMSLSPELEIYRAEIIEDLKEALVVRGELGAYSNFPYLITFGF